MRCEQLFGWAWRIAVLALPWQTRWFHDASLMGWPWEQGRVAVYASWIPILAAVLLGAPANWKGIVETASKWKKGDWLFVATGTMLAAFFLFRPLLVGQLPLFTATAQWFIQVLFLASFMMALRFNHVARKDLAVWFVLSLVPHLVLAFWQTAAQHVVGSTWLGIAPQLPATPGVSVVESGSTRFLRAYGGFPHPNIFGGWLAAATVFSSFQLVSSSTKRERLLWSTALCAIAAALFFTFSRSAWIAAAIGMLVLVATNFRAIASSWKKVAPPFFAAFLLVFILVATHLPLLRVRVEPSARLEMKSLDERKESLVTGWWMFRENPWLGTGPNGELFELARHMNVIQTAAPLQPPHMAYLLALAETGIVGVGFAAWGAVRLAKKKWTVETLRAVVPILAAFFVIGLFDYYPWSFWPGQSIAMIAAIFVAL